MGTDFRLDLGKRTGFGALAFPEGSRRLEGGGSQCGTKFRSENAGIDIGLGDLQAIDELAEAQYPRSVK